MNKSELVQVLKKEPGMTKNLKKVTLILLILMFPLLHGCRLELVKPAGGKLESVNPLIKKLGDKDSHIRNSAENELVNMGEQAVEPLIGGLGDINVLVRCHAAMALGKIGDKRAVDPLVKVLSDKNEYARLYAVRSLGMIGDERAVDPLIRALGDKDEEVRIYAVEALGKIGDKSAVESLISALDDESEDVRRGAAYVLNKMFSLSEDKIKGVTSEKKSLTNSFGMKFIYIPSGTYMMGSPLTEFGRDNDEKQHTVTLTEGFYIQTTEVTQGQWKAVMRNNPTFFKNCGDNCPVEQVSWNDAHELISKLNQMEGSVIYRLPTEAEWEYACRAGSKTAIANGELSELECDHDSNLEAMGWYCGNARKKTHPVAQKNSNDWGLYDMHGNVFEWCQDRYGDYYSTSITDPTGPMGGLYRVYRGGGWNFGAKLCRSAERLKFTPDYKSRALGFRLLRVAGGPK
jgi:formylglycine-generating enzyme required for sulfatase activity